MGVRGSKLDTNKSESKEELRMYISHLVGHNMNIFVHVYDRGARRTNTLSHTYLKVYLATGIFQRTK